MSVAELSVDGPEPVRPDPTGPVPARPEPEGGRYRPVAASCWRILAVAQRHWYVVRRSPHRLFDVILWPVVDTLLFASIAVFAASRALSAGQQLVVYTLTGIILWQVVYQSQIALSTGFLEETWGRNLLNLMATPLREWEYAAGVALFGLVKLICGVLMVSALAWTAYAFDLTTLGLGMLPVAVLLLTIGWAIALFVIGLVLRFGSGAEAFAWGVLFTVMPLSGVFYPTAALPAVLRPLADVYASTLAGALECVNAAAARVAATVVPRCPKLSVVVRGPAPGKLRASEIADALGLPLAGTLRPEPGLAAALERGEAPGGAGRSPLAALCRHLLADLIGAGSANGSGSGSGSGSGGTVAA